MHSIALITLYVKNWPKDQRVSISFWSQRFSRYRHVQTGYLTDLNWYTLEQVLTVPYGLLGRLDSACVSEVSDLCSHTYTREKWIQINYVVKSDIDIYLTRVTNGIFSAEMPLHWRIVRQSKDSRSKTYYPIRLRRHISDLPLIIRFAEQY